MAVPPAPDAPAPAAPASDAPDGAVIVAPGVTYLLVDGENIDATLGGNVLKHQPLPDERPRWDRIRDYAAGLWGQPVRGLFFLNATSGRMPMPFVQALTAMDYVVVPLSGQGDEKVVDIGIQRTLEAISHRAGDVLLASHDGDFVPQMTTLVQQDRQVGVLAFRECLSVQLASLESQGLTIIDLEYDAAAFRTRLPRLRIIPLAEFDPADFLL